MHIHWGRALGTTTRSLYEEHVPGTCTVVAPESAVTPKIARAASGTLSPPIVRATRTDVWVAAPAAVFACVGCGGYEVAPLLALKELCLDLVLPLPNVVPGAVWDHERFSRCAVSVKHRE